MVLPVPTIAHSTRRRNGRHWPLGRLICSPSLKAARRIAASCRCAVKHQSSRSGVCVTEPALTNHHGREPQVQAGADTTRSWLLLADALELASKTSGYSARNELRSLLASRRLPYRYWPSVGIAP